MGFWRLLGRGPLSSKKIARVAKLAANPFAQPEVRMREMQRLLQDGSGGSLDGVLRRFAANAQGQIADEDEKKWLENALVELGEPALLPLQAYIAQGDKLTYALRAYRRIAGDEAATALFLATLAAYGPEDHRASEAKLQLVWQLSEDLGNASVLPALLPFLHDHSDDVRWAVLELIERAGTHGDIDVRLQAELTPTLAELVAVDGASARVAQRTAEVLTQLQWTLPAAPTLAASVAPSFQLDKKKILRRKP